MNLIKLNLPFYKYHNKKNSHDHDNCTDSNDDDALEDILDTAKTGNYWHIITTTLHIPAIRQTIKPWRSGWRWKVKYGRTTESITITVKV